MTLRINRGSNIPPKLDNNLLLNWTRRIYLTVYSRYFTSARRAECLHSDWLIRRHFCRFLGPRSDLVPGFVAYGHQCERSIFQLVVPVQKLEHGTRVRALSPKVVFRHRTRARALVCTRFHQCHALFPCDLKLWRWQDGGHEMDGRRNDCENENKDYEKFWFDIIN